jgi:hypothetical protein
VSRIEYLKAGSRSSWRISAPRRPPAPRRGWSCSTNGARTALRAIIAGALGRNLPRADLRFGQDERGEVYVVTKQDGRICRMLPG